MLRPAFTVALLAFGALAGCITVEVEPPPASSSEPRAQGDPSSPTSQAAAPQATASTAPKPRDSDKDGISDKAERENGTDPSDAADTPYLLPKVPGVDAAALLDDLSTFVTRYNERHYSDAMHQASRDWLAQRFADFGLEVWRHDFTRDGLDQQNVAGIRWGLDPTSWVVIGAHYDTTTTASVDASQSQGAYDDGSGTMMVVHLARAFSNLTLPYTLVFVAFDGEERGLEGSQAFLADVLTEDTPYPGVTVVGAVDIDMFGLNWPGTGAPMVFITNCGPLKTVVDTARKEMGVPDSGIAYRQGIVLGSSDFGTFFAQSIPTGFFISDFDQLGAPMGLEAGSPLGVYPFWHLSDTMQTMTIMAGDEEHLRLGFDTGVNLAARLVHSMASTAPSEAGTAAV